MKREPGLAKKYGTALFQVAREKQLEQTVYEAFQAFLARLEKDADFMRRFLSRHFSKEVKFFILKDFAGKTLHPLLLKFFELLVKQKRESMFEEIFQVYQKALDEQEGRLRIRVVSAQPLSKVAESELSNVLAKRFNKEIVLQEEIDESRLGGFDLYSGDLVLKNSIQSKLEHLEKVLSHS